MKKIIGIIICGSFIINSQAKEPGTGELNDKIRYQPNEEINLNTYSMVDEGNSDGEDLSGPYIGFRYMPMITDLKYNKLPDGAIETDAVVGYGIGGILGYNFTNHFGLQAEVIYSSLAQKYTTGNGVVREVKLKYLNVPFLISLNTDISKAINLNFVAGPQLGLNVGSEVDVDSGNNDTDTVHTVLAVKKGDLGFAYGVGIDFGLGETVSLCVGFRGVYGLIDISDNSESFTTNDYYVLDRAHVKTYAGYVGLTFGF